MPNIAEQEKKIERIELSWRHVSLDSVTKQEITDLLSICKERGAEIEKLKKYESAADNAESMLAQIADCLNQELRGNHGDAYQVKGFLTADFRPSIRKLVDLVRDEALAEVERLKKELEQERVRLAGCGVAALGYGEELQGDAYGYSASYQDVLNLRKKYEHLTAALKELEEGK